MARMKIGPKLVETLACIGSPHMILVTPKKRDQRLVELGLAKHPAEGSESLCITPAGLRLLADEIEAGRLPDGAALAAQRRAARN
jgi:hypothetical protein